MGGAALGADVTDGPAPIVPGSLGIFGGTFDPIHVAHLAVAQEAAESAGLERVVFIPAGEPPHKPGLVATPPEERLAMVELAIAGNPRFAVDRREIDRAGPSYTVDTLEALHAEAMAADQTPDIRLIVSAEAFLELMTWREPRRVVELARIVVAPRDGYPAAGPEFLARHLPDLADRAAFLDAPRMRLSASDLRRRAASGRSLRYLVPDAVAAYIGDHGLYRNHRRTPST
jgi:nicotinate-nucleotide adenylyltransferase